MRGIFGLALGISLCVGGFTALLQSRDPTSYWIWAGIGLTDLPAEARGARLYLYQGNVIHKDGRTLYDRKGLFPHPLHGHDLWLTVRLMGGPASPEYVRGLYEKLARDWARHNVPIHGLQIDYDAPTARLWAYGDYLNELREALPKGTRLAITGLGDWLVSGDPAALRYMARSVDDIAFQLYQGRSALKDQKRYERALARLDFPYQVGLLRGQETHSHFGRNRGYSGRIVFLQK